MLIYSNFAWIFAWYAGEDTKILKTLTSSTSNLPPWQGLKETISKAVKKEKLTEYVM